MSSELFTRNVIRAARCATAAVLLSALLLTGAGRAAAGYTDAARDSTAGYDIASAAISESADGRVSVVVTPANADRLPEDVRIDLWFDLDNDLRTGDQGDEALVRRTVTGQLQFFRWVRSDLERRPATGMTMTFEGGVLAFSGPRSAFDNATSFGLLVVTAGFRTMDGEDPSSYDALPEAGRAAYVSPGPEEYADRVGDIPAAADITGVRVTDTKNGVIRFAIQTDVPLPSAGALEIWIDRDLSNEPYSYDRTDAQISFDGTKAVLQRYSDEEDELVEVKEPSLRVVQAASGIVVELHRRALDDVARFGFQVSSMVEDSDGDTAARDNAPELGTWTYRLSHRPPFRLVGGEIDASPEQPLAGMPFEVRLPVRRSDTGRGLTSGRVTCAVRAAGRSLRAKGSVKDGVASCKLVVPRAALSVTGTMTVRASGKSLVAWFAGAVEFGGGVDEP